MPESVTDSSLHADFEVRAREATLWINQARRLLRAAEAVHRKFAHAYGEPGPIRGEHEEDLFLFGPYLLLAGMAIENLFKAAVIQRRPEVVRDGRLGKSAFGGGSGHNLAAMAQEVSPELAKRHADLLKRLAAHVVWGGRYPVPLRAEDLVTQSRPGGPANLRTFRTTDPGDIRAVAEALIALISAEAVPSAPATGV